MRSPPPPGSVGGKTAVAGPRPPLVLVQPVELADLLGKAHALEGAHVPSRGGHEGTADVVVDVHDRVHHVVLGAQLGLRQPLVADLEEVAPEDGFVLDAPHRLGRYGFVMQDGEVTGEVVLGVVLGGIVVVEHVEAEGVREVRVDAVSGEASAQSVAAVVHRGHAAHGELAAHPGARFVAHAHEPASAQDALLGFGGVGRPGCEVARARAG